MYSPSFLSTSKFLSFGAKIGLYPSVTRISSPDMSVTYTRQLSGKCESPKLASYATYAILFSSLDQTGSLLNCV